MCPSDWMYYSLCVVGNGDDDINLLVIWGEVVAREGSNNPAAIKEYAL